jgi:chemotaxis-related protein WspB
LLGLIAEQVTETVKLADRDFEKVNINIPEAPFLGKVARDAKGIVQLLNVDKLLSSKARDILFADTEQAASA